MGRHPCLWKTERSHADLKRMSVLVFRVPETTFVITHSPPRSNRRDGFGFSRNHRPGDGLGPAGERSTLDDPTLLEIARRHGKSAAQVMLRWHLQEGRAVIPAVA